MNITGEIHWHLGKDCQAKISYSESQGSFAVDMVFVPAAMRGRGIGSQLLLRVLSLADLCGKDVNLTARPIGTSTDEVIARLISYYERFGFRVTDRGYTCAYMTRSPMDSQRLIQE